MTQIEKAVRVFFRGVIIWCFAAMIMQACANAGLVMMNTHNYLVVATSWLFIIPLTDQIRRNSQKKNGDGQDREDDEDDQPVSAWLFFANAAENIGWIATSWAMGELAIFLARFPCMVLDYRILWQALLAEKGSRPWFKYFVAGLLAVAAVVAIAVIPIWFLPRVQGQAGNEWTNGLTVIFWICSTAGWIRQICINVEAWRVKLAGGDPARIQKMFSRFSVWIPITVECVTIFWLLREYTIGKTGMIMYLTATGTLIVNTIFLLTYLIFFNRRQRFLAQSIVTSTGLLLSTWLGYHRWQQVFGRRSIVR